MTAAELDDYRAYLARKKRESRDRKKAEGFCTGCGVNQAKPDGVTCFDCDQKSVEYEREHGWRARPFKVIPRTVRKLRRLGLSVNDILKDPYLLEHEVKRSEVSEILKDAGLLHLET
jgi:hypothetical protein